jgi:hypothetical protein
VEYTTCCARDSDSPRIANITVILDISFMHVLRREAVKEFCEIKNAIQFLASLLMC